MEFSVLLRAWEVIDDFSEQGGLSDYSQIPIGTFCTRDAIFDLHIKFALGTTRNNG